MNFVFLDIDGVANSTRSALARLGPPMTSPAKKARQLLRERAGENLGYGPEVTFETIDSVAVQLINRLVQRANAKVVLSSSHRSMFNDLGLAFGSAAHRDVLDNYMIGMGFTFALFDVTPRMWVDRGLEVRDWLETYMSKGGAMSNYVILDDGRDFKPNQPLIWCDPKVGFSSDNYYEAMTKLGHPEQHIVF